MPVDSATGKKATWPGSAQGWFNPLTYEKGARLASGSFLPNKCSCARCKNFGRDANECEESHAPRVLLPVSVRGTEYETEKRKKLKLKNYIYGHIAAGSEGEPRVFELTGMSPTCTALAALGQSGKSVVEVEVVPLMAGPPEDARLTPVPWDWPDEHGDLPGKHCPADWAHAAATGGWAAAAAAAATAAFIDPAKHFREHLHQCLQLRYEMRSHDTNLTARVL